MALLRGFADDVSLEVWLKEKIWPAESRLLSSAYVRDGSRAAVAEMLAGGTTTFGDMYFFPESAIKAATELGMRIVAGIVVIDFPTRYASRPQEYLERGIALQDAYRAHPLVSFMFAPHAPYSVDVQTLDRIATYANEMGLPVQTHLHETASEIADSLQKFGKRPLRRLLEIGLVGPELAAVHMTQVEEEDLEILSRYGVNVVHCPESNLKLASGLCPAVRLLRAGVNLALGTDGAASNNDLDLIGEMRTAALLAKAVAGDASAFGAAAVLRAATLGGAHALGLADSIGSLVPGKWADMAAVDLAPARLRPVYDALSQLVYASGAADVSDVWVAGERHVSSGTVVGLDEAGLKTRLEEWRRQVAGEHSEP